MKVKIRTQEKCPVCGSKFVLTFRGMFCPRDPKVSPNNYYLDWYWQGEQFKKFGFDSFKDAFIKASAILEEIETHRFKPDQHKGRGRSGNKRLSFCVCLEKWLNSREKDMNKDVISPLYYKKLLLAAPMFIDFFGDEDIRQIKTYRIRDYYDSLPDTWKPKTQLNHMTILSKFFKDMYYVYEIINEMPRFPKIKTQKPTTNWISRNEQTKILQKIPEHHRAIFIFMFETGCRPQEARGLLWEDVDLQNNVIVIRHAFSGDVHRQITKGKTERVLPLSKRLNETLSKHPPTLRSKFVFNTKYGKPLGMGRLGKIWNKACKEAGVKGVKLYGGTRHSFASQKLNDGKSKALVGEWLGHADSKTTDKYAHVNLDGMRQVLDE